MSRLFLGIFSPFCTHIHIYKCIDILLHSIDTRQCMYCIYFTIFSSQCKHLSGISFCGLLSRPCATHDAHTYICTSCQSSSLHALIDREYIDCDHATWLFFFCILLFCDMLLKISPFRFILHNRNKFRKKNCNATEFFLFFFCRQYYYVMVNCWHQKKQLNWNDLFNYNITKK